MKTALIAAGLFLAAMPAFAQSDTPPEPKPTPAVCKADLKAWSGSGPASKTETLTLERLQARMNEMVACADEAHHHWHSDKRVLLYLDMFYRTHSELAQRAFDFIVRHDLGGQFKEEENGASENASNRGEEKP
jgi:hypothetical protein